MLICGLPGGEPLIRPQVAHKEGSSSSRGAHASKEKPKIAEDSALGRQRSTLQNDQTEGPIHWKRSKTKLHGDRSNFLKRELKFKSGTQIVHLG